MPLGMVCCTYQITLLINTMYNLDAPTFFGFFTIGVILFCFFLAIAFFAFVIWMLVDCINREEKDFKDRTLWIIILVIGIFAGYSGILSIVYYFTVKKELDK